MGSARSSPSMGPSQDEWPGSSGLRSVSAEYASIGAKVDSGVQRRKIPSPLGAGEVALMDTESPRDTARRLKASRNSRRRGTHFGMYTPEEAAARQVTAEEANARRARSRASPRGQGVRGGTGPSKQIQALPDSTDTALDLHPAPASVGSEAEIVLVLGEVDTGTALRARSAMSSHASASASAGAASPREA